MTMVPMGSPSRSMGTRQHVRKPAARLRRRRTPDPSRRRDVDDGGVQDRPARTLPRPGAIGIRSPHRLEPLGAAPCWAASGSARRRTGRRAPTVASHSRTALSTMASKTGWTSVGELEMTRRISPWPSAAPAPRQLGSAPRAPEQAHVLDRDDGLVGERLEERDLLGREGMGLGPPSDEDDAQRRALAQQRRRQHCPGGGPGSPVAGHGSGNSASAARMSSTWIVRRSRTARPLTVSRLTGNGVADRQMLGAAIHAAPPGAGAPLPDGRSTNPSPRTPGRRSRRRPP